MPFANQIDPDEGAIVEACRNYNLLTKTDGCFHRDEEVVGFIRYTEDTIVKFSCWTKRAAKGARNQAYAHSVVDPRVDRVPKFYHYFEAGEGEDRRGYTVMESIQGEKCDWHPTQNEFQKILNIIEHLAALHGDVPAVVGGGMCIHAMFGEAEEENTSVAHLEKHFNDRLFDCAGDVWYDRFWRHHNVRPRPLRIEEKELVLVPWQSCSYNIIWGPDSTPVLLD